MQQNIRLIRVELQTAGQRSLSLRKLPLDLVQTPQAVQGTQQQGQLRGQHQAGVLSNPCPAGQRLGRSAVQLKLRAQVDVRLEKIGLDGDSGPVSGLRAITITLGRQRLAALRALLTPGPLLDPPRSCRLGGKCVLLLGTDRYRLFQHR